MHTYQGRIRPCTYVQHCNVHSLSQEQLVTEIQPLPNVCFVLQGPASNPGLNQRALQELFHLVEERQTDYDYSIVVSVLEIYNECVRDLLSVDPTQKLDIKQGSDGVYVPGLTQVAVSQLEEVNEASMCCCEWRDYNSEAMANLVFDTLI